MALVILQHSYHLGNSDLLTPTTEFIIYLTTRIASVAFMAVSGMMISYFLLTRPHWKAVQSRFARRALLLLVVGHPLMWLSRYFFLQGDLRYPMFGLLHDYPITDTIALSLLIAPPIIRATKIGSRMILAAGALVVTPFVVAFIHPQSTALTMLKEVTFGVLPGEGDLMVSWPLVPWLAVFLLGSYAAEGLAKVRNGSMSAVDLSRRMVRAAVWLAPIGVVLTAAYKFLKITYGDTWNPNFFLAVYPTRTTTLLPIYLAALTLLYAFLVNRVDVKNRYGRFAWFFSVFGRTSLFTYVIQFVVIQSVPSLMGLNGTLNSWQPFVLFLVGVPICWLISYSYGRLRGWISKDDFAQLSKGAS